MRAHSCSSNQHFASSSLSLKKDHDGSQLVLPCRIAWQQGEGFKSGIITDNPLLLSSNTVCQCASVAQEVGIEQRQMLVLEPHS